MAQVIGYVKSLQNGAFFAKDAHGEVRELKAGDQIFKDELVFGAQNNPQNAQVIIDVTLTDASDIVLSGVDQLYADISVIGGSFETEDAVVATDSLENAWKLSTNTTTPDTTTPLEATAAGIEAPAAGLTTADGDRPINGTFYDRTGLIGDVRTTLTQDTVNGGTSQTIARVDTQDYNEQPTVENVTGSVNEALNGLNQISGQLVASDPDAGDTHTFFAVDGSLLINGEPAPEGVVLVLNEDGTYSVTGDFNTLAVGENAVITFQYYAVDNGLEIGETHTSLPATVTITIQGTNDQPVVSDISVNDSGSSEGGIVGYYDMASGQGVSAQVNGITSAGLTAAQLFTLSAEELANIGTLYVQNPSNSNYGSEYLSQLSAIQSAVSNGMTLIIHDRYVTEGAQILPGGESIVFHRLEGNGTNIEIIDSELETGASGNIDDSSLDNGSYSNHGYVDLNSLPEGATVLMTDGDPTHVVTFSYQYGAGTVIYSTIPLDHYLANSGNSGLNANMQIYAANLLEDFAKGNGAIYETRDSTDVVEVDDTTDDGRNVLSGALSVVDDDATDTHTFRIVEDSLSIADASEAGITSENVNVSIVQVDGVWQYNIDGDFSELAAGEKVTITFQYVADDGEGFDGTDGVNENSVSEPKTITLTITGTNDQPVVENVTLVSQSEAIDGTNTFAGTLAATDADAHDTHEFFVVEESVSVDKEFIGIPSIELNSQTGEYTLTGDFNALAVGESVTVTFSYYAVDSSSTQANGESKTSEIKTVTMTITGTNDVPVISETSIISGTATEAGNLDDGSVVPAVSATGTLVATDADHNATQSWSIDGDGVGTYGSFSIDANGNWTYTVDSTAGSAADKLKEGQSVTEQFTVIVTDDQGATDTQVVTITVQGTNDVPVAVADVNSVTEAGNGNFVGDIDMGSPIALGNLLANDSDVDNGSDIDVSKILSVGTSQSDTTPGWLFGNLDVQGSYGILVVNKETGLYAYALNNANGSVNALNEGDTLTDTFTYTVQDNNGAITTSTLTITINGTNDAPVISGKTFGMATEAGNYDNGTVKEATVATGTLIANDVDNDSVTWSIQGSSTKTYGSLSIDADGHWTYTINDTTGSAADKLAEGQIRYETFTIIASDNNPINPKTDMQEVTITIKGTNDSPVITNASSALLGTVVEAGSNDDGSSVAGIATISGQLSASDVDNGATQKWSIVGTADTTYGTISINANTGKWTYTLNNTDTDTQALAEGESKTLNYTARVIDDKGAYVDQTITITISGTNDAPVLTSSTALSFSVAEDAAEADADKSYSGNIGIGSLATDVDHGAVLQIGKVNGVTVGIDGVDQMVTFTYTDKNGDPASFEASLHVNQDGTYTISTSNDLNPLPAGVNATASLNFTITDENGAQTAPKTVNLTITGDNDAPTTETITLKAIAEDSGALLITQADLLANANDVDNANLSATNLAISSGNGTLVDNGNGTWSYTPASNDDTSVSFSYTISDGDKTVAGSATLDITPVNDAPVTTPVTLAAIAEDSGARLITQADLLANASDPVEHDSLVATDLAITSGKGSLVNNGDGTWTYTPASNDDTSVSFSYKITDNGTTNGVADPKTITGSATLDITPVNDAPDAIDDAYVISGLSGQYYAYHEGTTLDGSNLVRISQVESFIAKTTPDATFTASTINYGEITNSLGSSGKLAAFLGTTNASNLVQNSDVGSDAIIKLTGSIELDAGSSYKFKVYSDDGYAIYIDGQMVSSFDNIRSPGTTTSPSFTIATSGTHEISIVYWDQAGQAVLKVELSNNNGATYHTLSGSSDGLSSLVTNEDTPLIIDPSTLLGNDSDVDGDALSIISVQDAAHGTVEIVAGNVVFTPEANYSGEATFTYTISDGTLTDTATVTLYVNPINDAPIATPSTASGDEDSSIAVSLAGTDVDGSIASVMITTLPTAAQGVLYYADGTTPVSTTTALTPEEAANLVFKPAQNFNGEVTVSFTVTDNEGVISSSANAVITVNPVNDLPDAIDDSYSYLGDNLIINGSFEDINGVDANNQTVSGVALGSLTGTTLVHMKSITGWDLTDETMAPMEPHAGGHAGVGTTDGAHYMDLGATPGNSAITQTISGLTEGSLYQFSVDYRDKALMQGEGEASGVMQILWNGVVVATVQGNNTQAWEKLTLNLTAQNGDNTLTFKEIGTSNDNAGMAIDNVQLKSINTALVTDEDTALTIIPATLLGNDTDLDGDTLSISSVQNATHGTVEIVDGKVVFTPEANYNGVATFTYTISDNNGGTDTATVTLYVNPVNDAPITSPITLAAIAEDTTVGLVITQAQLLANASDIEGDTLVATGLTISAGNGTLVDNGNGTWTYTPASNDDTSVSFSYTISDGDKTVAGSATLDITPVNDAPVFGQASYSFNYNENSASGATLGTVNATDVDSATLTYSITGGNSNNYFTINATTGAISLTTAGAASFVNDYESGANTHTLTVGVSDGSTTKYVSVTLNEQNIVEATATADHIITNAGTALFTIPEWALLANDSGLTDITAVSNKSDLTTVTLNSDSITVRDDSNWPFDPDGGSFNYTADGSTAQVTITQKSVGDYILEGTNSDEIIISDNYGSYLKGKDGNDILIGGNAKDVLEGGNGNDTLTGENGSDELYGGSGNDTLIYDSSDDVINGGTGTDTLLFRENTSINFGALDSYSNPIENIEVFDLTKANVEMKNLSLQDVIDMTENTKDLYILGDTGDKVDFANSNGWSKSATPVIETVNGASHTFDVYTNAGDPSVVVKVEQNIHDTI